METLTQEEEARVLALLKKDEQGRDREKYDYAYDVLARNCVVQFSIWSMPNDDVKRVLEGEVNCDDIPFEDQNEVEKGIFFEELRQFIALHTGCEMLCEASNYEPCLFEQCPFFRAKGSEVGGEFGLCEEYKTVYRRDDVSGLLLGLDSHLATASH